MLHNGVHGTMEFMDWKLIHLPFNAYLSHNSFGDDSHKLLFLNILSWLCCLRLQNQMATLVIVNCLALCSLRMGQ